MTGGELQQETAAELAEEQAYLDYAYRCLHQMHSRAEYIKGLGYLGGNVSEGGVEAHDLEEWNRDKQHRIDLLVAAPGRCALGASTGRPSIVGTSAVVTSKTKRETRSWSTGGRRWRCRSTGRPLPTPWDCRFAGGSWSRAGRSSTSWTRTWPIRARSTPAPTSRTRSWPRSAGPHRRDARHRRHHPGGTGRHHPGAARSCIVVQGVRAQARRRSDCIEPPSCSTSTAPSSSAKAC